MNIFQKIGAWLRKVFTPQKALPPPQNSTIAPRSVLIERLSRALIAAWREDALKKFRETNGKNRSPEIDAANRWIGAGLGAPYCITMLLYRTSQVCKQLGLQNPIINTASTQRFLNSAPNQYKVAFREKMSEAFAISVQVPPAAIYIMRRNSDPSLGHAFAGQDKKAAGYGFVPAVEYNTDPVSGDRDGDGAYETTRDIRGNSSMWTRGWVDVAAWIVDHNLKLKELQK